MLTSVGASATMSLAAVALPQPRTAQPLPAGVRRGNRPQDKLSGELPVRRRVTTEIGFGTQERESGGRSAVTPTGPGVAHAEQRGRRYGERTADGGNWTGWATGAFVGPTEMDGRAAGGYCFGLNSQIACYFNYIFIFVHSKKKSTVHVDK